MTASDWFWLVVLSLFWGASFFFGQVAVKEIPPLTLALGRVAIAAAILLLYLRAIGLPLPGRTLWPSLAVMACLNNAIPFTLIYWSQQHIPSGLASILNATVPLFTIVVAHVLTHDDRITPARAAGVVIGFLGVVTVIGPQGMREAGVHLAAQGASLLGAFFYALSGVYGRRFQKQKPAPLAAGLLLFSTLFLLPLSFLFDHPWTLPFPSLPAIGSVLGVAAISTAAAFLIYFHVLARAGATNLLLVTFFVPISAILLGALFLNEALALRHFAGMAIIAIGLAVIDGRSLRWMARLFWR
jgi:drug/metabolite transporter (DMT)-like permease